MPVARQVLRYVLYCGAEKRAVLCHFANYLAELFAIVREARLSYRTLQYWLARALPDVRRQEGIGSTLQRGRLSQALLYLPSRQTTPPW